MRFPSAGTKHRPLGIAFRGYLQEGWRKIHGLTMGVCPSGFPDHQLQQLNEIRWPLGTQRRIIERAWSGLGATAGSGRGRVP